MYNLQPEKKSNGCVTFLAVIGLIALVIVGLFGVAVFAAAGSSASIGSSSTTHSVVYRAVTSRLDGDCFGFDATYEMPSGTSQKNGGVCNGSNSIVVDTRTASRGDFLYLSVQNDDYWAIVSCEIIIDGKLAYRTSSEGQYVIASCSGSVP